MKTFESLRSEFYKVLTDLQLEQSFSEELFKQTSWSSVSEFLESISPDNWFYMAFSWTKTYEGFEVWEHINKIWRQHYASYMAG